MLVALSIVLQQISIKEILGPHFFDENGNFTIFQIVSLQWWLQHLADAYADTPIHFLIETSLVVFIIYLIVRPENDPQREPLTEQEKEELIRDWKPQPLLSDHLEVEPFQPVVVESATGVYVQADDGKKYLNFASTNFLSIADHPNIKKAASETIQKYGVGSCGPRGFYGTVDVHLELEEEIAKFMGSEEAIVYSDGIACIGSVIPAFSKAGDLIVCDEGAHYLIQQGVNLSRSNVLYFKHNDINDLERVLQTVDEQDNRRPRAKLNRRFIIVEGLSQNFGDICNLKRVVSLKDRFKYRLILDDSLALGVIGLRGSVDYWDLEITDVEIYVANMDNALASVGGFCAGSHEIVYHQRLGGLGYCFSASCPPFCCTAAIAALKLCKEEKERFSKLGNIAGMTRTKLKTIEGVDVKGPLKSPLIHIRLQRSMRTRMEEHSTLKRVSEMLRKRGIIVGTSEYLPIEKLPPRASLKIVVTAAHEEEHISELVHLLKDFLRAALQSSFHRASSDRDLYHHHML